MAPGGGKRGGGARRGQWHLHHALSHLHLSSFPTPPPSRPRPHTNSFLGASAELKDGVTGLGNASAAEHGTFLGVETTTGQTLDYRWRAAGNVRVAPVPGSGGFTFLSRVTPVYLPLMWVERSATATGQQLDRIASTVVAARNGMAAARIGGEVLAALGIVGVAVFAVWASRRRQAISVSGAPQGGHADFRRRHSSPSHTLRSSPSLHPSIFVPLQEYRRAEERAARRPLLSSRNRFAGEEEAADVPGEASGARLFGGGADVYTATAAASVR